MRRHRSVPRSSFRSSRLSSLIYRHLLINHFHIKILEVYSSGMFDHVPTEKLKVLEVPTKEHSTVLLNLLETLDGLGSNDLQLLPTARSCSSFSNSSYLSALRSSPGDLTFSLTELASSIAVIKSFFNLEFFASKASSLDIDEVIFAS